MRRVIEGVVHGLEGIQSPYAPCVLGTLIGAPILGIMTVAAIVLQAIAAHEDTPSDGAADRAWAAAALYLIIAIVGWLAGWIVAVFLSPATTAEERLARRVFAFIGTFATGYVLGISKPFIEAASADGNRLRTFVGIAFFLAAFLTTLLITLVIRRYYEQPLLAARCTCEHRGCPIHAEPPGGGEARDEGSSAP